MHMLNQADPVPVYCLAFSDSERRSRMEARFAAVQVPCYFIEPISEAQIKIEIAALAAQRGLSVPKDFHFWATAIMQGHLKMIRSFVEETSASHGVFCEDDTHLRLSLATDLSAMVDAFDRQALDVLLLGYLSTDKEDSATASDLVVFHDYDDDLWGAQMYMLSRSRAQSILKSYDLSYALKRGSDDVPFASDWIITKQGRRRRVTPMLAVEEGGTITSDVGQSTFHRSCFEAQYDDRYYTPLSIGKTSLRPPRFVHDPGRGDTKIEGFPAVILGSCYAEARHLVPGYYEREIVDWCRDIVPKARRGQFVDCGAHMGSWTLIMASAFREVHAFEPQRLIYQQLCGNVALNGFDNVFAYNLGLDEQAGQLTLQRPRGDDPLAPWDRDRGRSTASDDVIQHLKKEGVAFSPELVKVVTLDSFVDVLTDVGLVKIDVEGLELRVLRGAVELLRRNDFPNVMAECWDWDWYKTEKDKLLRFLDELGYRIVPIRGYSSQLLAEKK